MPVEGSAAGVSSQVKVQPKAPPPPIRDRVVAEALWGIKAEPHIHYAMIRPIPVHDPEHTLPLSTDCSGFVTLCYRWAGAPDPNGRHYDGLGNTDTMLTTGKHTSLQQVQPGDLVVFGNRPGHHVCLVLSIVRNTKKKIVDLELASHGQEKGPLEVLLSVESDYQPAPANFLTFLP